jgi:hypothetical protein
MGPPTLTNSQIELIVGFPQTFPRHNVEADRKFRKMTAKKKAAPKDGLEVLGEDA